MCHLRDAASYGIADAHAPEPSEGVGDRVLDRWSDSLVEMPTVLCRSSVGSLFVSDARLHTMPPPSGGTYSSRGTTFLRVLQSHELTGGPQERWEARRRREERKTRCRGFGSKKIVDRTAARG